MDKGDLRQYAHAHREDPLVAELMALLGRHGISGPDAWSIAGKARAALDLQSVATAAGRALTRAERQSAYVALLRGRSPADVATRLT